MIVEKFYTNQNLDESIDTMEPEDLLVLEELANKYGVVGCFDILNEKAEPYYKDFGDSRFRNTGGYKQKGLSGVIQSIPSFAISAAISWPLTLIAALGAFSVRIQKRWNDEDAWRNRLNPRFWGDFAATPHGQSTPHEIAMFPVNAVKWTAGAAVAGAGLVLGSDKIKKAGQNLKGKAKEGYESAKAKILGYKTRTNTDSSLIDTEPTEDEKLTPQEVKNLDFRPYWITFDNGEIVKVRADSAENAAEFGKLIIEFLAANKLYENMNILVKRGEPKYTFWFDDGQVAYTVKETENEAVKQVVSDRKNLTNALNRSDDIKMKLDPMDAPKVIDRESIMGKEVSPMKKVKNVSLYPPESNRKDTDKLPEPKYCYGKLRHFQCIYRKNTINMACDNAQNAIEIIDKINKECVNEINANHKSMSVRDPLYEFKFGDGDIYKIAATSFVHAKRMAMKLHNTKVKLMIDLLKSKDDIVTYEERWGKIANAIKSSKEITSSDKKFNIPKTDDLYVSELFPDKKPMKYHAVKV